MIDNSSRFSSLGMLFSPLNNNDYLALESVPRRWFDRQASDSGEPGDEAVVKLRRKRPQSPTSPKHWFYGWI